MDINKLNFNFLNINFVILNLLIAIFRWGGSAAL